MNLDNKDTQREDVFDSLQGASSLTLLKKISIAAIAIALVAFFLFWSQSPQEEKSPSQDMSGKALATRLVSLEEEIMKLKDDMKKMNIGIGTTEVAQEASLKQMAQPAEVQVASQAQPESINLKSLFEEELKASSGKDGKDGGQDESSGVSAKDSSSTLQTASKTASKATTQSSKNTVYVVKKGDTLSKIALKFYGSAHKWKRIVDANKATLGSNNTLKIGMKLHIPMDE